MSNARHKRNEVLRSERNMIKKRKKKGKNEEERKKKQAEA